MIELIAHNLAPIMFISVMALLLLGYPVAFTLAAGGLVFFFLGVELSVFAPDQIRLFPNLLQANANRAFDVVRNDMPALLTGIFLVWFALGPHRPEPHYRTGTVKQARDNGIALIGVSLFVASSIVFPDLDAYELTAVASITVLLLHTAGVFPDRRPLSHVLEMTARNTAAALLISIAIRMFGLTFYAVYGHKWLESFGLPAVLGVKLAALTSIILIYYLSIRAVTHGQAIRSGAAA